MPLYSYKCPLCSAKLEVSHGMSDSPKFTCDNCKVEMVKLLGVGAVQFKGGGWGSSSN